MKPKCSIRLLSAIALLLGFACSEQTRTQTPLFSVDPPQFSLPKLGNGQVDDSTVVITNRGSGTLRLSDIRLEDESSANELALFLGAGEDLTAVPELIELGGDESISLTVVYEPSDDLPDSGRITLSTNDPDTLQAAIPIQIGSQAGEISVTPRTLDFGRVEVNESADRTFTVSNIGIADLVITRMSVEGRADFSARVGNNDALGDSLAEPIVIRPDETIDVTVTFNPAGALRADSELVIESNAINAPRLSVSLIANGALPCLAVVPEELLFGSGLIVESNEEDTPNQLPLTLESCGTAALRIDRVEFEGNDDVFNAIDLPDVPAGDPIYQLAAALPNEPSPAAQMLVGFWPTDVQAYGGRILIYSNAPESPHIVDLFGRGVDNQCPVPIVTNETYDVPPLDIITLDGTPSMDPGGSVERWEWTV
ncbi:MAG: choice-of-anchor D domain-containing protein, partial [Myxococcota bacterium]|nr:choice-of-anchor D domain-containing protein [Myxococcota bacterium]